MKKRILAAFKRYNANSKNINKGDCTARAMSLAFGLEYDAVYKELKQTALEGRFRTYNTLRNVLRFIERHGGTEMPNISGTVSEFTSSHQSGTYLLLTNKIADGHAHHIVAIIDGDVYDSWDSSNEQIIRAFLVSEELSTLYDESYSIEEAALEIDLALESYIKTQNDKYTFMYVTMSEVTVLDNATIQFSLVCRLDNNVPVHSKYRKGAVIRQKFIGKFNIKKTQEENVKSLIPKLKTKMYDWMYNIRKELQDAMKADTLPLPDTFRGDRALAAKLPEWCIPYLQRADSDGYWRKYELRLDAMEGDPRKSTDPAVYIEADNLTELRRNLQYYHDGFRREGSDY